MSVITVTATLEASNVPPRVRLNIADTGSPAFSTTTVTRLNPDGTTTNVRTPLGGPMPLSGGAALLYDYEAPYGQAVSYSSLETPANVTASVTVPASQVWLVHPGTPSLSIPVRLGRGSFTKRTRAVQSATFWPMGRSTPVVISDGARKSAQTQLVLITGTTADASALDQLLADASVLLLNIPTQLNYNFGTCYIAVETSSVEVATEMVFETLMTTTLPFTVVGRPAGGTQSQRTLADLLVYPTLQAVQSAYPTFAAVLAGP